MRPLTKLTFLGDLMCEQDMLSAYSSERDKYSYDSVFEGVYSLLTKSDYVFANLETPISYNNQNLSREEYNFNSPYEFAQAAKNAGVNFVSTANNHCLDRDINGIESTIKSLDEIGLEHTGTYGSKDKSPKVINVNDLKIGVMAYTYGTNAFANNIYLSNDQYWRVNLFQQQELSNPIMRFIEKRKGGILYRIVYGFMRIINHVNYNRPLYERIERSKRCTENLLKELSEVKENNPDLIVMLMHQGGQFNKSASDDTKNRVNFLLENGINIVSGTHEHVVHSGVFGEISQNKIATYSLGDFDGYATDENNLSEYSVAWHIYIDNETKTISKSTFSVLKTIQDGNKRRTVPVFDLYDKLTADEKDRVYEIVTRFTGKKSEVLKIQEEYSLN